MEQSLQSDVVIIDYGMGNLRSVAKAFEKQGATVAVTSSPKAIAAAKRVVLPGVGAFGDCMKTLRRQGLAEVIAAVIAEGIPFLGICLGMQVLFEGSEEAPGVRGLSIFPGFVRKIEPRRLKVPHMGWNTLQFKNGSYLFRSLPDNSYVYFVHSYHVVPDDPALVTACTGYGEAVTAAVGRGCVQAVQFHPEKSSTVGQTILANFLTGGCEEVTGHDVISRN